MTPLSLVFSHFFLCARTLLLSQWFRNVFIKLKEFYDLIFMIRCNCKAKSSGKSFRSRYEVMRGYQIINISLSRNRQSFLFAMDGENLNWAENGFKWHCASCDDFQWEISASIVCLPGRIWKWVTLDRSTKPSQWCTCSHCFSQTWRKSTVRNSMVIFCLFLFAKSDRRRCRLLWPLMSCAAWICLTSLIIKTVGLSPNDGRRSAFVKQMD